MSTLATIGRTLLLGAGIALTAYWVTTPGDQFLLAVLSGALLAAFVASEDWER